MQKLTYISVNIKSIAINIQLYQKGQNKISVSFWALAKKIIMIVLNHLLNVLFEKIHCCLELFRMNTSRMSNELCVGVQGSQIFGW